ncbi:MAG: hypothetical protein MK101_04810 [Phycisphaerales bacterium]|nr:hypothetical protein [Phycisphaerales bacterium]
MRAAIDWIVIIAAGALVAAIARVAIGFFATAQGGLGPTLLDAAHPLPAAVAVAALILVMCTVAIGAARIVSPLLAMGAIGAGLGWGALGLEPMRQVLIEGSIGPTAVDGVLWTIVVLALSWVLLRSLDRVEPPAGGTHPDPLASSDALRAALVGAIAGLLAVSLIAQSDLRQQTAVAAVVGGLACGFAGRLASPHVRPVLVPPALVLAGTLAAWIGSMMMDPQVEAAVVSGDVPRVLLLLPIDWVAGALLGVPMGFAAAQGFLKHDDDVGTGAVGA